MSVVIKIIFLVIASIIILLDIAIFITCRGKEYSKTGLKVFLLEDLFFVGEKAKEKIKISNDGKRIRNLAEIYDNKTAGKIARSASFASYTYILLFSPIIFLTIAVSENIVIGGAILLLIAFQVAYFDLWLRGVLSKRHEMILKDFATVLSKMSLLVNAGVTGADAFKRVAFGGTGILYEEMQRTSLDIENGMSIDLAMEGLAFRSGCKEVRKFVSLYKQNLMKGGPEFPALLNEMAGTAWEERKTRARLAGTSAEQKLLLPIMLMFIGVLIMVIVPAFNNLL